MKSLLSSMLMVLVVVLFSGCASITQKGGEFGITGSFMGVYATIKGVVEVGKITPDPVVTNTPDPVVTNTPNGDVPDVVYMEGNKPVKWSDLKESCTAKVISASPSGYTVDFVEQFPWPSTDGKTDGRICATWKHNDKMIAFYWDGKAVEHPYTYVSLNHWTDDTSPIKDVRPAPGQQMWIFSVSEDNTQRSALAETTWMGQ